MLPRYLYVACMNLVKNSVKVFRLLHYIFYHMIYIKVQSSSVPNNPVQNSLMHSCESLVTSVDFHLQREYFLQNLRFPGKLLLLLWFKSEPLLTFHLCLQTFNGLEQLFQVSQLLGGVNWCRRGIFSLGFTENKIK